MSSVPNVGRPSRSLEKIEAFFVSTKRLGQISLLLILALDTSKKSYCCGHSFVLVIMYYSFEVAALVYLFGLN